MATKVSRTPLVVHDDRFGYYFGHMSNERAEASGEGEASKTSREDEASETNKANKTSGESEQKEKSKSVTCYVTELDCLKVAIARGILGFTQCHLSGWVMQEDDKLGSLSLRYEVITRHNHLRKWVNGCDVFVIYPTAMSVRLVQLPPIVVHELLTRRLQEEMEEALIIHPSSE